MRPALAALLIMVLVSFGLFRRVRAQHSSTITVDGLERTYEFYAPASVKANQATSLVIALHGGGGQGRGMRRLTGFNALADEKGFLVVYPDGLNRQWNDSREFIQGRTQADDVAFIRALIAALKHQYSIERVFVTGISNGAMMTYRLACELSDQITAAAPVAGNLVKGYDCKPSNPVPLLAINGTTDPLVPYNGGAVARKRGDVISTDDTMTIWASNNGCTGDPTEEALPNSDPSDGSRVNKRTYPSCSAPLVLYRIENGGHTWPGGSQYLPKRIIGSVNRDINATQVIWAFFDSQK